MIIIRKFILLVAIFSLHATLFAAPYENLVKKYSRTKSLVMVRTIHSPTLANLDYAAYNDNPIRFDPSLVTLQCATEKVSINECTFDSTLTDLYDAIDKTPLTKEEKEHPLAWVPLQNHLWQQVKTNAFVQIASKINGYKWFDKSIQRPYQEVVAAYLHTNGNVTELWVRVEFGLWVNFLQGIHDDDGDGFKEIYGKLSIASIDTKTVEKAFRWIQNDYEVKELQATEITDWANILASYWYPTLNTDIVDIGSEGLWPTKDVPPPVKKQLNGIVFKSPVAVICGKPFDKKLYNVFLLDNAENKTDSTLKGGLQKQDTVTWHFTDTVASKNFRENTIRFSKELEIHGGTYEKWAQENAGLYTDIANMMKNLPSSQMGFAGKENWLFFRKEIDYMLAGDLATQPEQKNPLTNMKLFKKYCDARGIDLLFVAVPNKSDVYFDKLPLPLPKDMTVINPYGRKILDDMQKAGIEVIDLLPLFLKEKLHDTNSLELVYQKQDTHWTDRGIEVAAAAIGNRVKEYAWFTDASKSPVSFTVRDTTFDRLGDIVDKMPEDKRGEYPPVSLHAQQVIMPDNKLYSPNNRTAPVLLIGDSFTGVYELVDCKASGVGSHIAKTLSVPVDIVTSWGGGPLVGEKMLRSRSKDMVNKRLIIYMMVARDLYNYAEGWGKLP